MKTDEQISVARDAAARAAEALGLDPDAIEVLDRDGKTSVGKDDPTQQRRTFRVVGPISGVDPEDAVGLLDRAQKAMEDEWSFRVTDTSKTSRWLQREGMKATLTVTAANGSGTRNARAEVSTACVAAADLPPR